MTPDVCSVESLPEGVESGPTVMVGGQPHHWHTMADRGGSWMRLYRGRGHNDPEAAVERARAAFNDWMSR